MRVLTFTPHSRAYDLLHIALVASSPNARDPEKLRKLSKLRRKFERLGHPIPWTAAQVTEQAVLRWVERPEPNFESPEGGRLVLEETEFALLKQLFTDAQLGTTHVYDLEAVYDLLDATPEESAEQIAAPAAPETPIVPVIDTVREEGA